MNTRDECGGVDADSTPPLAGSAYWLGWKIARAAHAQPGSSAPQSGFVLDGYGGRPSYAATITAAGNPSCGWNGGPAFAFPPDGSVRSLPNGSARLPPRGVIGPPTP